NAAPALTVVWGILLLDEPMTPALIVGGLLVLAGIVWTGRKRPEAQEHPIPVPSDPLLAAEGCS
ncbi:MAG TPA: hypothetical protein VFT74_09210, partial [Isosphaeraceae bacterium]|nr:hypothetical protein [Isosphaeraceae bacterium]